MINKYLLGLPPGFVGEEYLEFLGLLTFCIPDRLSHPSLTVFALIYHYSVFLPSSEQWPVCKRNARVLINDPRQVVVGLDSAQYGMMLELYCSEATPSITFLYSGLASCFSQKQADPVYQVIT